MFKKILLIGLVGISLLALVVNEASAGVCILRNPLTGACRVWSGSIVCGISASQIGNIRKNPEELGCTATGTGYWVVVCGNPGSKRWTSPGINLAYFSGTLTGAYTLTPADVDHNGNAYVYVTAPVTDDILGQLDSACPNPNWIAIDAAPCTPTVTDQEFDVCGQLLSDAVLNCTLPNCETLGWDNNTQKLERREYNCTVFSRTTYTPPPCE